MISRLTQYRRFQRNRGRFNEIYKNLKKLGNEPFVMPFWNNVNKQVLKSFQPIPEWSFLSNRAIIDTMFVAGDARWLQKQITFLQKKLGSSLAKLSREDIPGKPLLLKASPYKTSHNTLHHLYHIYYYFDQTKVKKTDVKTVVEWGGGYGNFAKLWRRVIDPKGTYIIIDTALFCSIQWLYLGTIFGFQHINIVDSSSASVEAGKINLVPVALLDNIDIEGDLFVSTWGLSESLDQAQDYVLGKKWFGCDHLLIGFQDSTKDLKYASRLGSIAAKSGAKIIDIEFIPNNHYALR